MTVTQLKAVAFIACLLPLTKIVLALFELGGLSLGANPIEEMLHRLGWWALVLLMITLSVTPVRNLLGWQKVIRLRRMLGLFTFTYAALHLTVYVWLDQGLNLTAIIEDIIKRPYITIGMAALTLMLPLAITSNDAMVRRLKKRWKTLHKLIYPIALLAVWHFYWQVKKDISEPLIFAAILASLLGYRLVRHLRRRRAAARTDQAASAH